MHRCRIVRYTFIVSESVKSSGFPTAEDGKIEKRMRKWFANRCKGSGYKAAKKSKKMKSLINEMPVGAGNVMGNENGTRKNDDDPASSSSSETDE